MMISLRNHDADGSPPGVRRESSMIKENTRNAVSGFAALALFVPVLFASGYGIVRGGMQADVTLALGSALILIIDIVAMAGLFVVNPNEGRVLQLFGSYVGTVRTPGLR